MLGHPRWREKESGDDQPVATCACPIDPTVSPAQAGYMHYRVPLLENGVELYEVRSLLGDTRGNGQTAAISRFGHYSLHASQKVFIGSMNFDQRSMHLNTEIGLIIDNPTLVQPAAARFEARVLPVNSYRLALRPNLIGGMPELSWHTQEDAKAIAYDAEPGRSEAQRAKVSALSLLPLDKDLRAAKLYVGISSALQAPQVAGPTAMPNASHPF